jgi:hypothetical protein
MKHERGLGGVYQPSYKDYKTGEKRLSPIWWIFFNINGEQKRLSSKSKNRNDAVRLLKRKLAEAASGKPIGAQIDKTSFEDLARMLTDNYEQKGNKSFRLLKGKLDHLRAFFEYDRARDITSSRIDAYIAKRLSENAARATVN